MSSALLGDVRIFVTVVEQGSFTGAARVLHLSKSSISRRIAVLEEAVGARLIQRTARSVALTESGEAYYSAVAEAVQRIDAASTELSSRRERPAGTLRILAPPGVGDELLPRIVTAYRKAYPEVTVEVSISAIPVDLIAGGFDLALRGGTQPDSSLSARKVQDPRFGLYASPTYLEQHRLPSRPQELAEAQCVVYRQRDEWLLENEAGAVERVKVVGSISSDSMAFTREAAVAGAGIALLPLPMGQAFVERGALVRVLSDYYSRGNPLFLVYPTGAHLPLRVRLFRDFVLQHIPQ